MYTSPSKEVETTMKAFSGSSAPNGMSRQLFYFFNQSEESWAIKDISFKFLYVNQHYIDFLQIPQKIAENITGFSYEGVPSLASLKDKLVMHDQKVMQSGQRVEAVGTVLIGNNFRSFIFEKFPYFNDQGDIVGTVSHLKPFERLSLGYFLEMPFYGEATFTPPTSILSKREWEVLFLLYRGLHRAHISHCLNISEYSARNIISRLFLKTGVSSKEQLLDLGLKQGWHLYVPPRFVSIGYDILFKENI
ncbi:LuxR C-terminal-related transcriptional regulator [Photorhabdus africana]|uniref:LuxR C-terminal-related transcriptional regulator n=1 Tax=Photorhabdus africana TaxID=3097554 RepID=UPI002B40635A|nr:LuxR C-terminal-related transcriptional regulator [Photorhabdus sp. CRI-LC]